jgi:hypothetical protein
VDVSTGGCSQLFAAVAAPVAAAEDSPGVTGMGGGTAVHPEGDAAASEVTALTPPTAPLEPLPPVQPRGRKESQRSRPPELTHLRAQPDDAGGAAAVTEVDVRSHLWPPPVFLFPAASASACVVCCVLVRASVRASLPNACLTGLSRPLAGTTKPFRRATVLLGPSWVRCSSPCLPPKRRRPSLGRR